MTTKERDALLIQINNQLVGQGVELTFIKDQVVKTNGRVTQLEAIRIPKIEHQQSRTTGRHQVIVAVAGGAGVILGIIATIIANA